MSLRENLASETIASLGTRDPIAVSPHATIGEAISLLQNHRIGCVVVTEDHRPVGIFTERDVLRRVLSSDISLETPVSDVMTSPATVVSCDETIGRVINTLVDGGFRHVPVVDASGVLQRVVSVKRIVEYVVDHFPAAVFNLPPEPGRLLTSREGA